MSDYTRSYDGAAKDTVQSVLAGADFDSEFDLIQTAVNSKANLVVPAAANNVGLLSAAGHLLDSGVDGTKLVTTDGTQVLSNKTHTGLIVTGALTVNGTLVGSAVARGALVYHSTTQSISTSSRTILAFNTEDYDTDVIHDNVTNNSRLVVPAGVTKVRVTSKITMGGATTGYFQGRVLKNGSAVYAGNGDDDKTSPNVAVRLNPRTAIITVVPGDYFQVDVLQSSGGSLIVGGGADGCWFNMEIIK